MSDSVQQTRISGRSVYHRPSRTALGVLALAEACRIDAIHARHAAEDAEGAHTRMVWSMEPPDSPFPRLAFEPPVAYGPTARKFP